MVIQTHVWRSVTGLPSSDLTGPPQAAAEQWVPCASTWQGWSVHRNNDPSSHLLPPLSGPKMGRNPKTFQFEPDETSVPFSIRVEAPHPGPLTGVAIPPEIVPTVADEESFQASLALERRRLRQVEVVRYFHILVTGFDFVSSSNLIRVRAKSDFFF